MFDPRSLLQNRLELLQNLPFDVPKLQNFPLNAPKPLQNIIPAPWAASKGSKPTSTPSCHLNANLQLTHW